MAATKKAAARKPAPKKAPEKKPASPFEVTRMTAKDLKIRDTVIGEGIITGIGVRKDNRGQEYVAVTFQRTSDDSTVSYQWGTARKVFVVGRAYRMEQAAKRPARKTTKRATKRTPKKAAEVAGPPVEGEEAAAS